MIIAKVLASRQKPRLQNNEVVLMMNAKIEFLNTIQNKDVLCAVIEKKLSIVERLDGDDDLKTFVLRRGFTDSEMSEFLKSIDFEYDNGYGTQELFGFIWYKNGLWNERRDYDGSENWVLKEVPQIPEECNAVPPDVCPHKESVAKKIRVYKSKVGNIELHYDNVEDAANELREILTNGLPGDYNEYSICEMTKEAFDALPEFEGR